MLQEDLREMIDAGAAKRAADLVICNGQLVNVNSAEIYPADVAIYRSQIVATGDVSDYIGPNTQRIDAKGKYLVPGLIDGHLHIECSKLSMTSFAKAVVPHGTTSIISGLDQYIVTSGLEGIREVLNEIDQGPLKVFWGLPFITPYTLPQSNVGFNVTAETHREVQKWPEVFGVWETVSEFVENQHDDVMKAIELARENRLPVFGCAPMTRGKKLNSVLCAGLRLDHESYDHQEMMEKVRKGMYVLIRESSISHFMHENMKIVTHLNPRISRRVSFCTDDVIASDIMTNGHMDKLIRMAISCGVDPITAIQMGSINSAEAYRIDHLVGSISPGRFADILLVEDLREFNIDTVIAKGKLTVEGGKMAYDLQPPVRSATLLQSMKLKPVTADDMKVRTDLDAPRVHALSLDVDFNVPFVRKGRNVELDVVNGVVLPDVANDVLYATVVERFGKTTTKPAVGFCSGWKLKAGAMASSCAPDDNNVICIGTNSEDMAMAINHLAENGGGQVIVRDGKILGFLPLPICGIVSDLEPEVMAAEEEKLLQIARELGCDLPDPLFYMCCLQITAIPDYAITDLGVIDFHQQKTFDPVLRCGCSHGKLHKH
ncbi:Adenine deaminase [Leminorella richardii]|uniref:Adenine deaminase n=1 Tax=Leminorella richardii TaxID=158841 RepID=A0A2X4XK20_9GAMM|nr:adenine deaminase C-terminal domain-containing protein [Leminorella richardii]SQI40215.1 Adenine deaminase [Leminorella richardii]